MEAVSFATGIRLEGRGEASGMGATTAGKGVERVDAEGVAEATEGGPEDERGGRAVL